MKNKKVDIFNVKEDKTLKKIICFLLFLGMVVFPGQAGVAANRNKEVVKSDPWVYTITHRTVVSNPDTESIYNIQVTIPLMNDEQPVFQEFLGEELSPWPVKIIEDKKGTRLGVFHIAVLQPGEEKVIEQRYAVRNFGIDYKLDEALIGTSYSRENFDAGYLAEEKKIESANNLVIQYARDVVKDETSPYQMARKLFADINLFMTYQNEPEESINQGAVHALRTGIGNCEDYTALFIAAARSLGIPARAQTGYLYLPREQSGPPFINEDGSLDITLMRHTWPEILLPKQGWVVLDPTYTLTVNNGTRKDKVVDWSKFGQIAPGSRHIFFTYGRSDDAFIEIKYSGAKPQVDFSENLVFGHHIFPFRDSTTHWAKDSIRYLSHFSPPIIGGYGNGLFGPDDLVTRAQLAAMLNRALSLDYHVSQPQFSDITPGYWGYADIAAAKGAGIVGGFPDGTFRPEKSVTRAELAVIIGRAFNFPRIFSDISFQDLGQPGYAWADEGIINLAESGIVAGYPGNLFRPEKPVTRAEVAVILSRAMDGTFRLANKSEGLNQE
ncbi:S-layer homology domain-containing protein [Dehalobacterium formicoaceticum]|uniref:S-layer homology domain-containing protein n=1 Tax=Dehalobacterium formicoaceticum TaxID=51515 RepID=A0ABT1Y8V7_9FIRM|nr:S-layer homology domain-containing protein [Dehalobacterium formicoaceticum]MCR6546086.1 S-layer homology domain-containing protein [Dehalobacterium formicoaceticum]